MVTAKTQLLAVQAASIHAGVLISQDEHAFAAFNGRPPADLTLRRNWKALNAPPAASGIVLSRLLEPRPDLAAAKHTLQENNALEGPAVAVTPRC